MASQTLPRQYLAVMAAFALMAAFAFGLRAVKAAEDDLPLRGDEAAYREMGRISAENFEMIKEDEAKWFDQSHCWIVDCETIEEDPSGLRQAADAST